MVGVSGRPSGLGAAGGRAPAGVEGGRAGSTGRSEQAIPSSSAGPGGPSRPHGSSRFATYAAWASCCHAKSLQWAGSGSAGAVGALRLWLSDACGDVVVLAPDEGCVDFPAPRPPSSASVPEAAERRVLARAARARAAAAADGPTTGPVLRAAEAVSESEGGAGVV